MEDIKAETSPSESEDPLFSIVTPTYNAAETVEKTIASILGQEGDIGVVEHLIQDGGSTDATLELLKKYPHLKVVSESDDGIYDAMNRGIARAKGRYIAVLNADDVYEPHTLKLVRAAFEVDEEVGLVHGDMNLVDGEKVLKRWKPVAWKRLYRMWVGHATCVVRREIYEEHGNFNLRYPEQADYDLITRLRTAGVKFTYIPEVLTNFLVGGFSAQNWSFRDSVEIRRKDGHPWPWAVFTSLVNRYYFVLRLKWNEIRSR